MICPKCGGVGVAEETISYQMECRNHLFCFEDVPAPKCPDCGHYTITEEAMSVMLAKVEQITQKATISYHRCRWPKAQQIDEQQPTAAVAEVMETLNKSARK
ncbi:MAG: YgiT-type zinc finger protein [Pseudomonadota bacterium]|nr:YgiT-type zinc finger protein [Pseudomonadota bacterium]